MMNWYLQNGRDSDIVISTRVRVARNLEEYPFPTKFSKEQAENVLKAIKEIVPSLGYGLKFINLNDIDDITKVSLVEKHVISPEFAANKNKVGAILINKEENICMMINEEDHIRLQVFSSGLELENLKNLVVEIDEKLDSMLNYAVHSKYGYLTACPTNVGTAMRASVMVHLPALTMTGNINKILNIVNGFGMNIRGIYGEGTQSQGEIYQISNNQTLGLTENDIIKNINTITEKVIDQERMARKYLAKNSIDLEDRVYRAYGTLAYATKLSSDECKKLLSYVKLGTDLGIIKELDDSKITKLYLYNQPANLQKYVGKPLDGYEREIKRPEVIKEIIQT
ncbi:MAG: protein arginine kinase [Clostridia bacterium]|nr:protein arginine kinase [Clostridia bacterium]